MMPRLHSHLGGRAIAVGVAMLVVCTIGVLAASWHAGDMSGTQLLEGRPPAWKEDVTLKLQKVAGAGYTLSNVEGLRAKALLEQAKAIAKKGRQELEAASKAHLTLDNQRALLAQTVAKQEDLLRKEKGIEAEADASEELAARALLSAKDAMLQGPTSKQSAGKADVEALADSSEATANLHHARVAFERAIQDAIDQRKATQGIIDTSRNIAYLKKHIKHLKHRLLRVGTWESWGSKPLGTAERGRRPDVRVLRGNGGVSQGSTLRGAQSTRSWRRSGGALGALGDKLMPAGAPGEPLVHALF